MKYMCNRQIFPSVCQVQEFLLKCSANSAPLIFLEKLPLNVFPVILNIAVYHCVLGLWNCSMKWDL